MFLCQNTLGGWWLFLEASSWRTAYYRWFIISARLVGDPGGSVLSFHQIYKLSCMEITVLLPLSHHWSLMWPSSCIRCTGLDEHTVRQTLSWLITTPKRDVAILNGRLQVMGFLTVLCPQDCLYRTCHLEKRERQGRKGRGHSPYERWHSVNKEVHAKTLTF